MSTLINPSNAPRDLTALSGMSNAVLYRLAMALRMFRDDANPDKAEEAERAFASKPVTEKAQQVLQRLLEIDSNPQAAAELAMPMQLPNQTHQETMSQQYGAPPAPPGFQTQLPFAPGGGAPQPPQGPPAAAGWGQAPPAPPGPSAPPAPPAPPGGTTPWQQQPGQFAYGGQPQGGPPMAPPPPAPPGPPGPAWGGQAPGFHGAPPAPPPAPPGPPGPPMPPAPPGPPGAWGGPPAPPGPPSVAQPQWGGPPPGPPMAAPQMPPMPQAQQPVYSQPPVPPRNPSTPSDPTNQGTTDQSSAAQQLLSAINGLTVEMKRQNEILGGLSTLVENGFITSAIIADRMQIPRQQLAHILAAEREAIKSQLLGKA